MIMNDELTLSVNKNMDRETKIAMIDYDQILCEQVRITGNASSTAALEALRSKDPNKAVLVEKELEAHAKLQADDDEEELIAIAKHNMYMKTQAAMADLHEILDALVKKGGDPTMGQGMEILSKQDPDKGALARQEVERIYAEASEEELMPHHSCIWGCDDEEEPQVYSTECNNRFFLDEGTIEDNGFKYCPYCGWEIDEAHTVEPGPGDVDREGVPFH